MSTSHIHAPPATGFFWDVRFETGPAGRILILRLAGDIDAGSRPELEAALAAAMGQASSDLLVDVAAVRFCCVRGIALLVDAAGTADARGIGYAMSGSSPYLDRIAHVAGRDEDVVRYGSVSAAVNAIRVDQTYRSARTAS